MQSTSHEIDRIIPPNLVARLRCQVTRAPLHAVATLETLLAGRMGRIGQQPLLVQRRT